MSDIPVIETIAIGDELLTGKIADTNSAWVAEQFFRHGLSLYQVTVVPDDEARITQALALARPQGSTVVVFGGLGPTSDDKTAKVVADFLAVPLVEHGPSRERMEARLRKLGREITAQNLKQIFYPEGTEALFNGNGAAPGFSFERDGTRFFFMPGVPSEMKMMFTSSVLAEVLKRHGMQGLRSVTWKCMGIPESELQRLMNPVEANLKPGERLGYRTRFPENHLTLYCDKTLVTEDRFMQLQMEIAPLVAKVAYTAEDVELEELVLRELARRKVSLAIAESCTGGLAVQRISRIAGASQWLWGGCAVYQVAAKKALLGIELSRPQDAVSKDCTAFLCDALQGRSGGVAAAITGYMGPSGGTASDPVGAVYWCISDGKTRADGRIILPARDRVEAQWGASTLLIREILRFLG